MRVQCGAPVRCTGTHLARAGDRHARNGHKDRSDHDPCLLRAAMREPLDECIS
eukprot:COSAG06_NODE_15964_length_1032_cov_1.252947_3_plen_52_part_01